MRRMLIALFSLALVVSSTTGQSSKPASGDPLKRLKQPPAETVLRVPEVVVPMRGTPTVPLVEVHLNGEGPFLFQLNTGADFILVQKEVAAGLGLKTLRQVGDRRISELGELAIGDAVFKGLVVAVDDWEKGIDGVLGFTLFRQCVLTMDFPGEKCRLSMKQLAAPDGIEILKYRHAQTHCPYLMIQMGQKTIPFLINTGLQTYLQIQPETEGIFRFKFPPVKARPTTSFPIAAEARVGRVSDDFNLGRHIILQPVISILPGEDHMIGCGIWQHFILSFDPFNKTVRMYRPSEVPIIIPSVRELGFRVRTGEEGCFITGVDEWMKDLSVDLRAGDQLMAVESMPAGQITSNDWIFFERNLNYIELTLRRDGEEITIEVPLKIILP